MRNRLVRLTASAKATASLAEALRRRKADTTCVIAAIVASATVLGAALPDPVKTDAGLVAAAANSPEGVRVFRGIPFGAPPIGPLRWKAPQPVARWDGVRKADAFGPVCVPPNGTRRLNASGDIPA